MVLCMYTCICWRRQWHPTPVLLPGKSHGQRSLVGCSPWGREESDMTERLCFSFAFALLLHWRRKWQPTPVFLPEESQGRGSLVGSVYGVAQSQTRLKRLSNSNLATCICRYENISCVGVCVYMVMYNHIYTYIYTCTYIYAYTYICNIYICNSAEFI